MTFGSGASSGAPAARMTPQSPKNASEMQIGSDVFLMPTDLRNSPMNTTVTDASPLGGKTAAGAALQHTMPRRAIYVINKTPARGGHFNGIAPPRVSPLEDHPNEPAPSDPPADRRVIHLTLHAGGGRNPGRPRCQGSEEQGQARRQRILPDRH